MCEEKCKACNGTGFFEYEDNDHTHEITCDECNGSGVVKTKKGSD